MSHYQTSSYDQTSTPFSYQRYALRPTPHVPLGIPEQALAASTADGTVNAFNTANALSIADVAQYAEEYLQDCALRLYSANTVSTRRVFFRNLLWFLHDRGYAFCGASELRQFFHYLMHGHEESQGRFGNKQLSRPVRPVTVRDYYWCFRSFFDYLVTQQVLTETPFLRIAKPQVREEVKPPLSEDQISALLRAAGSSSAPARNTAIVTFLLDTGCRASELVSIYRKDLDLTNGHCRVLGKGNKYRTLFFGRKTAQALKRYLDLEWGLDSEQSLNAGATADTRAKGEYPLFLSARGEGPLTRSGLLHLIKRLGKVAGFKDEACVHALRRSFAVQMLKNGANVFSVQAMLGHTNLQQTRKYCELALSDAEAQHRQFSPMDGFSDGVAPSVTPLAPIIPLEVSAAPMAPRF